MGLVFGHTTRPEAIDEYSCAVAFVGFFVCAFESNSRCPQVVCGRFHTQLALSSDRFAFEWSPRSILVFGGSHQVPRVAYRFRVPDLALPNKASAFVSVAGVLFCVDIVVINPGASVTSAVPSTFRVGR